MRAVFHYAGRMQAVATTSTLVAIETHEEAYSETYETLLDMAFGKSDELPPELLVEAAMAAGSGADWPVMRAAMQALLRRLGFARRDALRVASRPSGRRLGTYTTRRRGRQGKSRPYQTVLLALKPVRGSCDCPDFVRSSLGLCKHLLVVLKDIYAGKRKCAQALREQLQAPLRRRLSWDPRRPLVGDGDWLERVQLHVDNLRGRQSRALAVIRPLFSKRTGRLKTVHAGKPVKRHKLVVQLQKAVRWESHSPALAVLLELERKRMQRVLDNAASLAGKRGRNADRSFKRRLYPYQVEGVRRFLATGRLLLADDMGLGKTVQAIASCHTLYQLGRVKRGLIIVPASLKSQWLREWQACTDIPAAVVEGPPDDRAALYAGLRSGFLIMNYALLLRDLSQVQAIGVDIVVLDEAQRIKNWETKTAAYVKSLRVPYRLVLTGTPLENRLDELASIYDWVDDMALEPKWRLTPWHSLIEGDASHKGAVYGARNLETLRQRIAPSMVRRVRQEVLSQLPPRTDTRVPVPMTPQQRDEHDALTAPIARLVAISKRRPLRQHEFLRLMTLMATQRMISNGLALIDFEQMWPAYAGCRPTERLLEGLFSPKLLALRKLVEDIVLVQRRKVAIFSQWRRMLRWVAWALDDLLTDAGLRLVHFTGAQSQKQRTQSVVELHDDPSTMIMLLSDAGGVGLNLQRAATCCINLEMPWNPAVLEQRIGRIYRIGQSHPIDVYNLVSEQGIEARIASIVTDKQALFTGLFDGDSNEVLFESGGSSMMSKLEELIDPATIPSVDLSAEDVDDDMPRRRAEQQADKLLVSADERLDPLSVSPPSLPAAPALHAANTERPAEQPDTISPESLAVSEQPPSGVNPELSDAEIPESLAASEQPPSGVSPEPLDAASPESSTTSDRQPSGAGRAQSAVAAESPYEQVTRLVSAIEVRSTDDGRVALVTPPEAVAPLAMLLGKLGEMLAAQAPPPAAE